MKEKIKNFIEKNFKDVEFNSSTRSELNGVITVLSGYALFIGASKNDIEEAVFSIEDSDLTYEFENELDRVFEFAKTYQYGKWWNSEEAKKEYKF